MNATELSQLTVSLATLGLASALLLGCASGPTPEERAARQRAAAEAYRQAQQRHAEKLAALRVSAESRLKAGESAPAKPDDPGLEILQCVGLSPAPFTMQVPVGAFGDIICGNSERGQQVLAYRRWYCGSSERACVYGKWSGGEPRLVQTDELSQMSLS